MCLVPRSQPVEHGDSHLNGRFPEEHRLETPFQRLIFLDKLTVLVKGSGADALQFAVGKGWF